jgi:histone H3/H4
MTHITTEELNDVRRDLDAGFACISAYTVRRLLAHIDELQSRVSDEALRETAEAIENAIVPVDENVTEYDITLAVLRERMGAC